jgi:hypothetical protein
VKGLYGDFPGYRLPGDAEIDEALLHAVVCVDANVLLNLYRYNRRTAEDLVDVLSRLGDRLVIPHQAVAEFWTNRRTPVAGPPAASKGLHDALGKNRRSVTDAVDGWAKQTATTGDVLEAVRASVGAAFDSVAAAVDASQEDHDPEAPEGDPWLSRLEALLADRVTDRPTPEVFKECVEEGQRRAKAGEPPGFLDLEKADGDLDEGAAGDYLVWFQATREAQARDSDLVVVTSDEKEDWWWRNRAAFLGPRPELTEEYLGLTGRSLFMLRPGDLLARSHVLQVDVGDGSVEDADRSAREDAEPAAPWTVEALTEALERLDRRAWVQAAAVREAAANGGRITRRRLYELSGYDAERTLRGFTRPVAGVTADLQAEGLVDARVAPLLTAAYPDGVKASYFRAPPEVPGLLGYDPAVDRETDGS